jgi:hypothetical protein
MNREAVQDLGTRKISADGASNIGRRQEAPSGSWLRNPLQKWTTHLIHLIPCNFLLFPKLKSVLKGQTFAGIPDIQHNMTMLLAR